MCVCTHAGALFEPRSAGNLESGQEPFGVQEQPRAAQERPKSAPRTPQERPPKSRQEAAKRPRRAERSTQEEKSDSKTKSLNPSLSIHIWRRLVHARAKSCVLFSSMFLRAFFGGRSCSPRIPQEHRKNNHEGGPQERPPEGIKQRR